MFISNIETISAMRELFGKKIAFMHKCISKASSPEKKQKYAKVAKFLQMKVQHTMFVQQEGMNIFEALKERATIKPTEQALNDPQLDSFTNLEAYNLTNKYLSVYNQSLLWHDLGRAAEFDRNANPTGIDHAAISKRMAEKRSNNAMLILAIRNHGYPTNEAMYQECEASPLYQMLTEEEKRACKIISLLVRDADKLGNWKTFVKQGITREVTQRIKPEIFRDCVSIGNYEMQCIRENTPINYSKYTNFSGVHVAHMMWASDMALKSTKEAAIKGNYVSGLIEYMDEVARDDTALRVKAKKPGAVEDYAEFLNQTAEVFKIFSNRGWISPQDKFNSVEHYKSFMDRLKKTNYATPRVLVTGMQRYVQNNLPPHSNHER